MKTAVRPVSRLFLLAVLGACSRRSGEVTAQGGDPDAGATSPGTDDVPDSTLAPAPTLADPKTPERWVESYQHPLFHPGGPLSARGGDVLVESIDVIGGKVENAHAVIVKGRAGFRACYSRGLASDPEQQGIVRIVAKLNPLGAVIDAKADRKGTLSQEVTDCVVRRVSFMKFADPEVDGVRVVMSMSFAVSDAAREHPDGGAPRANPRL